MFGRVMAAYESVRREGESTESSSHVFEKCSREKNLREALTARTENLGFMERAFELRLGSSSCSGKFELVPVLARE